jgi:hypothetical protein
MSGTDGSDWSLPTQIKRNKSTLNNSEKACKNCSINISILSLYLGIKKFFQFLCF